MDDMRSLLFAVGVAVLSTSTEALCPRGFMGSGCSRPCRDIYRSCEQWQTPEKCDELRPETDFFDLNCAKTCALCQFDNSTIGNTDKPLPPILEPLAFMVGRWESSFSLPIRYPTDHYQPFYNEVLDIEPMEVIMFGTPSLKFTSESRSLRDQNDVRMVNGFLSVIEDQEPPGVALLATSNEGLNTIEIGTIESDVIVLNMTYMQIHPELDLDVLPVGGSRLFRRDGPNLEMSIIKLDRRQRIGQFTKFFKKTKDYVLF